MNNMMMMKRCAVITGGGGCAVKRVAGHADCKDKCNKMQQAAQAVHACDITSVRDHELQPVLTCTVHACTVHVEF
jgi:hypothetical protein